MFEEALAEIKERAPKGKKYSEHLNYKIARERPNEYLKIVVKNFMDNFPPFGAHSSPPRSWSRFKRAEKDEFKIGLLLDNPRINRTLGELAALSLYFVFVIDDFLSKYDIDNIFHLGRLEHLEQEYDSLAIVKSE